MGRENEVRELAYLLWEQHGCPHGRAEEFWLMAEERLSPREIAVPAPVSVETAGTSGPGKEAGPLPVSGRTGKARAPRAQRPAKAP